MFFCAAGQRSALATQTAQRMGLKPVAHIAGGFGAWKEAGGPVEAPGRRSRRREGASMALKLIIGNKNYSSWSFRPWIAMKVAGIPFEEEVISLNADDFKARVSRISGTGKVPALVDGDVQVWESLAILEYLAEKFPAGRLWPADAAARAHGPRHRLPRCMPGFVPLRRALAR